MSACTYRPWIRSLFFVLALGFVAPAAAQKAALVRDADRPSVFPVSVMCSGVFSCDLYTVPANMVLVIETVSYRVQKFTSYIASPAIRSASPTSTHFIIFKKETVTAPDNLVSDVVAARSYHKAGQVITFLSDFPTLADFVFASLDGYLVPAGAP